MKKMNSLTLNGTTYNRFSGDVESVNGQTGTVVLNAEDVGALPDDTVIPVVPSTLPNPYKLTFTGAVEAEYDGSSAVSVEIPEGEKEWERIFDVELTEAASFEMTNIDMSKQEYIFYIATPKMDAAVSMGSSTILGQGNGIYYASLGSTAYGQLYVYHFIRLNGTKAILHFIRHSNANIDGAKYANTGIDMQGYIAPEISGDISIKGVCPVGTRFRLEAR